MVYFLYYMKAVIPISYDMLFSPMKIGGLEIKNRDGAHAYGIRHL